MYTVGEGLLTQDEFLFQLTQLVDKSWLVKTNKKIEYYNVPAGFDIETSSFYQGEQKSENKRAIMYIWQFGIYNLVTTGRTWEELDTFLKVLKQVLQLNDERRLIVYVHNLPYEFQFIRKRFDWQEVFLLSERKPVYANAHGIEFRCSLKLAGGKSLEKVGEDLQKYKVKKAVGQLDYDLIRTPLTQLTELELEYCEMDIRVILCYIQEKIEQDGDITRIPLTNTGYVRQYCRKECFKRWRRYHNLMQELTVGIDEYSQLKRAFQGGFTHANAHHAKQVLHDVGSHDFTSSYPAVMLLEKFPMSRAKTIDKPMTQEELERVLLTKCCLFELELWGVIPIRFQDHPISRSKCYVIENYVVDNGRVVMAEHLKTTITEQDYFVYKEFYSWDKMSVSGFRYYERQYLPKEFVMAILGLYGKKTALKDIEGEEINYMISKNMMNSAYGMIVTDPVREEMQYTGGEYFTRPKNVEEGIERYNTNIRRFLYYPWGVWVTAYARANLFSGIIALGDDYVYSDTDSVKSLHTERHTDYFDRYNEEVLRKIELAAAFHHISTDLFSPVNKNGEAKTIGIWEDEGVYDLFKTLGAKRYMTYRSGAKPGKQWVLTLAGANKKKTMQYLIDSGKPLELFDDSLVIPPESSGRTTYTYIDYPTEGVVVDYTGRPYRYSERTSAHMEASEYNLSLSEEYIKYLKGIIDFGE